MRKIFEARIRESKDENDKTIDRRDEKHLSNEGIGII